MHILLRQAHAVGLHAHSIHSFQLGWLNRFQSKLTSPSAAPPKQGGEAAATPSGADAPLGHTLTKLEAPRHSGTFWAVEPPLPIVPPPTHHQHTRNSRFIPLCFDNTQAAYRNISSFSLVRAIGVLSICRIEALVKNADGLYTWSRRIFGPLPSFFMRYTFFAHFCAGEDQDSIQPTVQELHRCGIGAILDYAAESDVHSSDGVAGADSLSETNYSVIARTYSYDDEKKCDSHVRIFMRALEAARTLPGQGFAAIKVTALGNPNLLHMLSNTIEEVKRLFARFDLDGNGFLTKEEFCEVYGQLFVDEDGAEEMFEKLNILHNDKVDYVTFVDSLKIADIPQLTSKCRNVGPLKLATPSPEELELMEAMVERVRGLCRYASDHDLRIMIDAEHCYLQPAIDSIAKDMMKEFNGDVPVVYNTYQCYLKDSRFRLNADIESARRQGYMFAAKLVRGAYMVHENKVAKAQGVESPVHESIEGTHANYNRCVRIMIQEVACGRAEVMIATHNQYSVETAVRSMHDFGLQPHTHGVFFGQLLGMADHLSHVLGRHKYRAYKYVPFGPLEETMPYLIRRAQENGSLMGGVVKEMSMLHSEVWRRMFG